MEIKGNNSGSPWDYYPRRFWNVSETFEIEKRFEREIVVSPEETSADRGKNIHLLSSRSPNIEK